MDVAAGRSVGSKALVQGLHDGYSQEQWGPWKSHSLLLQESVAELGWQEPAQTLSWIFKEHAQTKDGFLSLAEFSAIMQKYPCCSSAYHQAFFELFDRNQDGYISDIDFLSGMFAVSPLTPHKLESPPGQLRMQYIFLYYDANRNGHLEVEEVAKMITHIQSLRGQPQSDAMVDATALVSLYPGPFGFAAFHDAAQKRMLNGTSPLLRLQQDLADVARMRQGAGAGAGPTKSSAVLASTAGPAPPAAPRSELGSERRSNDPLSSLGSLPGGHLPAVAPPLSAFSVAPSGQSGRVSPMRRPVPGQEYWGGSNYGAAPAPPPPADAEAISLRIVRYLMEVSNGPRTDWRYNLQLATAQEVLILCGAVVETLRREDSLVEVALPCRVYGDIHGQLLDLLEFFNAFAWPDKRRGDIYSMSYVFLGDFVDRGAYSCEVVILLFALKIMYPRKIFLVRGNHEDRLMNMNYGFHESCTRTFLAEGEFLWERMNDVFEFLPIAAHIEGMILCIHGGIGDCIDTLDDLRGIPKPIQIPGEITASTSRRDRIILHALWSDPTDNDQVLGVHTSPRGKNTCRFGPDLVHEFNRRNNLKLIVRAHECVQRGYEYFAGGQLLTVFSATNYCNEHNNDGAMIILTRDEVTGEVKEHAQVIKSGSVDTSSGWSSQQFRAPSPMRGADALEAAQAIRGGPDRGAEGAVHAPWAFGAAR